MRSLKVGVAAAAALFAAVGGAPAAGPPPRLGLRRAAEDVRENADDARRDVEERVERAAEEVSHAVKGLDLSSLTPAQAAAAQAAIAAVGKAEQAFGASDILAGISRGGAEGVSPLMRDVAQQAAMLALGLWQGGRGRAEDAVQQAEHRARDARDEVIGLAHTAADKVRHDAHDAREDADDARERAERAIARAEREAEARAVELRARAEDAVAAARLRVEEEDARKGGAAFMWIAAILGLVFYALMGEERRRQVARFSEDASVQVREVLRDLKGYDDEF